MHICAFHLIIFYIILILVYYYYYSGFLPFKSQDCKSRLSYYYDADSDTNEYQFDPIPQITFGADNITGMYFEIFTNDIGNDTLPAWYTNINIVVANICELKILC